MHYIRLLLLLILFNTILMWWMGDFNLYLGEGAERELKAFPTPQERVGASLVVGFLSAVVTVASYWLIETAVRRAGSNMSPGARGRIPLEKHGRSSTPAAS
jgi:hypothetical protein